MISALSKVHSESDLSKVAEKSSLNSIKKSSSEENLHTLKIQKQIQESSIPSSPRTLENRGTPTEHLNLKEVFRKMKPLICKVVLLLDEDSDHRVKEETGFFINNTGLLVASFCLLNNEMIVNEHFFSSTDEDTVSSYFFAEKLISVELEGTLYPVSIKGECSPKTAQKRNLCILQINDENFTLGKSEEDFFVKSENSQTIQEGDEIYFGGYPLTQKVATFHKGFISSLSQENGLHSFTIDGTVVSGLAGAPILKQKNGQLHLVGVIQSDISDLHPQFAITTDILSQIAAKERWEKSISCRIGNENISFGTVESLYTLFRTIQSNMSTGMGKAIHACHIDDIFRQSTHDEISNENVERHIVSKLEVEQFLQATNWELKTKTKEYDLWEKKDTLSKAQIPILNKQKNYSLIIEIVKKENSLFFKKKLEALLLNTKWQFLDSKNGYDIWGFQPKNKIIAAVKFPSDSTKINDYVVLTTLQEKENKMKALKS